MIHEYKQFQPFINCFIPRCLEGGRYFWRPIQQSYRRGRES